MATKKKYKMEITTSTDEEQVYFEQLKMRIVAGGLEITAKSRIFGEHFASVARPTPTGKPSTFAGRGIWSGGAYFALTQRFPPAPLNGGVYPDLNDYFYDNLPNMLWLTHKDLAEGFSLIVPLPISLNDLEDYVTASATLIQNFYRMVLHPMEVAITFKVLTGPAQ